MLLSSGQPLKCGPDGSPQVAIAGFRHGPGMGPRGSEQRFRGPAECILVGQVEDESRCSGPGDALWPGGGPLGARAAVHMLERGKMRFWVSVEGKPTVAAEGSVWGARRGGVRSARGLAICLWGLAPPSFSGGGPGGATSP